MGEGQTADSQPKSGARRSPAASRPVLRQCASAAPARCRPWRLAHGSPTQLARLPAVSALDPRRRGRPPRFRPALGDPADQAASARWHWEATVTLNKIQQDTGPLRCARWPDRASGRACDAPGLPAFLQPVTMHRLAVLSRQLAPEAAEEPEQAVALKRAPTAGAFGEVRARVAQPLLGRSARPRPASCCCCVDLHAARGARRDQRRAGRHTAPAG